MIVVGIILVVLVLLALFPLGMRVHYEQTDYYLKVLLGPFYVPLLQKTPKQSSKPPKEKAKKKAPAQKKKKSSGGSIADFWPFVQIVVQLLRDFRRKLVIHRLELAVSFGVPDAAQTALNYGRACAVAGGVMALLQQGFRIKRQAIFIQPDFVQSQMTIYFDMSFTICLSHLLYLMFKHGLNALREYRIFQKKRSAEEPAAVNRPGDLKRKVVEQ